MTDFGPDLFKDQNLINYRHNETPHPCTHTWVGAILLIDTYIEIHEQTNTSNRFFYSFPCVGKRETYILDFKKNSWLLCVAGWRSGLERCPLNSVTWVQVPLDKQSTQLLMGIW